MPRTIEKTVYLFDELSDSAKEKARQWFRDIDDNDMEHVYDDAVRMGELLGIDINMRPASLHGGGSRDVPTIYYSGFSSQGDGACFEGSYQYKPGAVAAITKETGGQDAELIRVAQALQAAQKPAFYQLTAETRHSGHYYHSGCMYVETANRRGNDVSDDAHAAIRDELRSFADWIYKQLNNEYDYRNADEQVDENIRANEYEFDENGGRA